MFYKTTGEIFIALGFSFIVIGIFDIYTFTYHPFQRNVWINVSEARERRSRLHNIENMHEITVSDHIFHEDVNIYDIVDHQR
jgi:hypothetical protein